MYAKREEQVILCTHFGRQRGTRSAFSMSEYSKGINVSFMILHALPTATFLGYSQLPVFAFDPAHRFDSNSRRYQMAGMMSETVQELVIHRDVPRA